MVRVTWQWLAAKPVRPLLTLWTEAYARSLAEPGGPWSGVARQTVEDWLALLAAAQPTGRRSGTAISAEHTLALAVLRGGLLDLLATGDTDRVTAAIQHYLRLTSMDGKGDDATPPTLPDATGDSGTVLGRVMWVDLRPVEIGEAGARRAWAAMVAAVRASRPQNVRAPWSATSMMIGVDPDKASHTAVASRPGHQPEQRADLGGVPAVVRRPRPGPGRDRADQGRLPAPVGRGQPLTGRLSDTLGRKPLIVTGMIVQAAAFPAALLLAWPPASPAQCCPAPGRPWPARR
jgi:hypothetical protein